MIVRRLALGAAVSLAGLGLALVPSSLAGASSTICSGTLIGGTVNSSLTVAGGSTCTLDHETVNGSVIVNSDGSLITNTATISGSVSANQALLLDIEGGKVGSSLIVNSLSHNGDGASRACGATFGSVAIKNIGEGLGGNEFDLGDDGAEFGPCPGNTVTGSVTLTGNSAETEVDLNTIGGSLVIAANTGPVDASGNTVAGTFTCSNPVVEGVPNLPKDDEAPNVVKGAFTCQLNTQG